MHFAIEPLAILQPEFDELLASYFDAENEDHVPLQMDWALYKCLESLRRCYAFTTRDGRDNLVACVLYIVGTHTHHKQLTTATCDIICVRPSHRRIGIAARLMEYAQPFLVADGATQIIHQFKHNYKVSPLFISQGFEPIETTYRKKVT